MIIQRNTNKLAGALSVAMLGTSLFWASASNAIPASYGDATHSTEKWQQLGTHEQNTDGVFWSVDGTNWGHEAVSVGDSISFKFLMHKKQNGTHYADYLKAWVDWDQDGAFDDVEESDNDDVVMFDKRIVGVQNEDHTDHLAATDYTDVFTSESFLIDDSIIGDLFMRARMVCSADLGMRWPDGVGNYPEDPSYDYDAAFNPTGRYGQGEVEEYTIKVLPVPEPSTIALFALGLVGLAGTRRKS